MEFLIRCWFCVISRIARRPVGRMTDMFKLKTGSFSVYGLSSRERSGTWLVGWPPSSPRRTDGRIQRTVRFWSLMFKQRCRCLFVIIYPRDLTSDTPPLPINQGKGYKHAKDPRLQLNSCRSVQDWVSVCNVNNSLLHQPSHSLLAARRRLCGTQPMSVR
jgi:hypothetical protein